MSYFDELQNLINKLRPKIDTIRAILLTNQKLREIIKIAVETKQESEESVKITELIEVIPEENEWRIYERCAAITRLYAVYEKFVEDLISLWLEFLPEQVSSYSDLDERIRNTHCKGVGRLLLDLKKNKLEASDIDVVKGLLNGITGKEKYYLIPQAFLLHEQNLRKDELDRLLADAGIADAWRWVNKYMESQNIGKIELNELISYRNDAAHGAVVDEILGFKGLLELCDFIESLCQALAELVTYRIIATGIDRTS